MAEKRETISGSGKDAENYQVIDYQFGAEFHIHVITGDPLQMEMERESHLAHWHTEIEIVCTYRGEAQHFIDGQMYKSHPGSVIITNPCSLHWVIPDETLEPVPDEITAIVLHFRLDHLESVFPSLEELYFTPTADTDNERLPQLFRQLVPYADDKEPVGAAPPVEFEYLHIRALLYEILYEISKDRIISGGAAIPISRTRNLEQIREAIEYVQEHYAEPMTEAEVAERFYFSREYFARLFKKNTNMTFMEFLSAYRVSKGWEQLVSTDRTVLDIALECGFHDGRSFINAFKKRYHDTPLQYRKKWKFR